MTRKRLHKQLYKPQPVPVKKRSIKDKFYQKFGFLAKNKIPFWALNFLFLWIFCSWVYGDVFHICEQFSYFAFDHVLMRHVEMLPLSGLVILGRFLLLSYKSIFLGGLFYAVILTGIVWLLDALSSHRWQYRILGILIVWGWLFALAWMKYDIFYYYDAYFIFAFPFALLIVLALAYLIKRLISKKSCPSSLGISNSLVSIFCVLLFGFLTIFTSVSRENMILYSRMMQMSLDEDWDGMVKTALKAKQPTRCIAAFYAAALIQKDQLLEKLFDMNFNFPDEKIRNRTEQDEDGLLIYEPELNLYSGLINSSYHINMEQNVISDITIYRLKKMVIAALVHRDIFLAEKYLNIIAAVPFESKFIEKYRPMLYDRTLINKDDLLSRLTDLYPTQNGWEEQYAAPLYLTYYAILKSGNSTAALKNSITACLYAKDINGAIKRAGLLKREKDIKVLDEIIMLNLINKEENPNLSGIPLDVKQSTEALLECLCNPEFENNKSMQKDIKRKYLGKYAYYYYFENNPKDEE